MDGATQGKDSIGLFAAACIVLLASTAFLHLHQIGGIPSGFHCDESSTAYNAWCVAETGRDEHGAAFPVFFKCFGDYKNPVMIYVLVPFIRLFGPEKWAVRLPSALFHILASAALALLVWRLTRDRWTALLSGFVFSVLPWAFPVSRLIVCGFTFMLMCLSLGCVFLFEAVSRRSAGTAALAGLCWAGVMYSTHVGRPVAAVILFCFILAFNRMLLKRLKVLAVFAAALFIFLIPMVVFALSTPQGMTSRFNAISVWRDSPGLSECVLRIASRYLEYFGPSYLFVSGDPNLVQNINGSGELYVFLAPLAAAGVYVLARGFRRNPFSRFMLLGLLSYPAAAALTISHCHSTRSISGAVFWTAAAALGTHFLWRKRKSQTAKYLLFATAILAAYEIPSYFHKYFTEYGTDSRGIFDASIIEAVEDACSGLQDDETLYLSKYLFFPMPIDSTFKPEWYPHILFFRKIPPAICQKAGGVPSGWARIYDGSTPDKGVLVRPDVIVVADDKGNLKLLEGYDELEPVPKDAALLRKLTTPSGISVSIYKVGQ